MFLGIDIHKRYSQVAVVKPDGNLHDEIRLPNDRLDELAEEYAGSEAAIEASGSYRPVYETLDEHCEVTLVNPSQNRIIADATVKTDRVDAKRLAMTLFSRLAELGVLVPLARQKRVCMKTVLPSAEAIGTCGTWGDRISGRAARRESAHGLSVGR